MESKRPRSLVLGITDIFFLGRIEAARASAPGLEPVFVQPGESLSGACAARRPCVLIVDLLDPVLDPLEEVARIKSGPWSDEVEVIGFLPHVRMDLRESAVKAGVDRILVRSAFTQLLPGILAGVISGAGS